MTCARRSRIGSHITESTETSSLSMRTRGQIIATKHKGNAMLLAQLSTHCDLLSPGRLWLRRGAQWLYAPPTSPVNPFKIQNHCASRPTLCFPRYYSKWGAIIATQQLVSAACKFDAASSNGARQKSDKLADGDCRGSADVCLRVDLPGARSRSPVNCVTYLERLTACACDDRMLNKYLGGAAIIVVNRGAGSQPGDSGPLNARQWVDV